MSATDPQERKELYGFDGEQPLLDDLPGSHDRPALVRLTDDRHKQALYRLAALDQYLYHVFNGDDDSDRDDIADPLPELAMDSVREAQRHIREAIKRGERSRRSGMGGEIQLIERVGRTAEEWKEH